MDIDLIVAASGNPPNDAPPSLNASSFSSFHSAGSVGASSATSMSSNTYSVPVNDDPNPFFYATSPQSLPSGFGFGASSSTYSYHQAASLGAAVPEPTKPYKRQKRGSGAFNASPPSSTSNPAQSSSNASSSTAAPSSQAGSMESMMFGWKLTKPAKNQGASDSISDSGRKRSKSSKTASASQPRLPFTSPLQHPHHRPFVPPVNYGVYDPMTAHFQRALHAGAQPQFAPLPPPGLPPHLAMPHQPAQFSSAPTSPSDYSFMIDSTAGPMYQSPPMAGPFDLPRSAPFGAGRLTPDFMAYDMPPQLYPALASHTLAPTHMAMDLTPRAFPQGSPVPSTSSSPRTPTSFGLSPLAASSPLTSSSPGILERPERPLVGLPGSNGTSAFQVVAPKRSSKPPPTSDTSPPGSSLRDSKDKLDQYSPPSSPSSIKKKKKKRREN